MTNKAPSLHLRVLLWLIIPLFLMSCVMMIEVYYSANRSTESIQDKMLVSHAIGITEHALGTGGDLVYLDLIQKTTDRTVFYKVEGPNNAFVSGHSGLPVVPVGTVLKPEDPFFYDNHYHDQDVRMVAFKTIVEGRDLNGPMIVYVGQHSDERKALVWESVRSSLQRQIVLIILAAVLAWIAVTQGLKPLTRLEQAIGRRSFDDMRPLQAQVPREARNVVKALNSLFQRLQTSMEQKKRFIANASHQLRTPIASLMAQTELALRKSDLDKECGELTAINDRANQMSRLVKQLLSLARADSVEQASEQMGSVDLVAFVRETTLNWLNDHHNPSIDLGFESDLEALNVSANHTLLSELLTNLIDNADHYCPEDSPVTVRVDRRDDQAILEVEDEGPGIPAAQRDKVMERFYRLQEDRIGTGLGLAIAREVALRHQGTLSLLTPDSGQGLLVRLEFPITNPLAG